MTDEEGRQYGMPPEEIRRHFRIFWSKYNKTAISTDVQWYRKLSFKLNNPKWVYTSGDSVGVAERAHPNTFYQQAMNNRTNAISTLIILRAIAAAPANGLLSIHKQSGTRYVHDHAARALRCVTGIPSKTKDRKIFLDELINDLLDRKLIEEVEFKGANRSMKTGLSLTKPGMDRVKELESKNFTASS
jgi:hypothetical protein